MEIQFSVESSVLLPALSLVSGAIEKKQDNPMLSHILFSLQDNRLLLTGTDLELECLAKAEPVNAGHPGKMAVPAKKLMDICRSLPDKTSIDFSLSDGKLLIKIGRSRFSISCLPADEFPALKDYPKEIECSLQRDALLNLLQSCCFSMAQQDVRYYLNGLLIETSGNTIRAVCTDGHRLATSYVTIKGELPNKKIILPRKAVYEFIRLLNGVSDDVISLSFSERNCLLRSEKVMLVTKLVDGAFPNYQAAIPENNDKEIIVQRDDLKQSLSRVSVLANEKAKSIKLTLKDNLVTFTARNQDKDEALDELMAHTSGEECSIGLNVAYLLDVVSNAPDGEIKISFSTAYNSILITSAAAPNANYIIMPVKI